MLNLSKYKTDSIRKDNYQYKNLYDIKNNINIIESTWCPIGSICYIVIEYCDSNTDEYPNCNTLKTIFRDAERADDFIYGLSMSYF